MLFCRVDIPSIKALKDIFAQFHKWSGLKANQDKSNIFFFGVSFEEKNCIKEELGYEKRSLIFKYLGVPIKVNKLLE